MIYCSGMTRLEQYIVYLLLLKYLLGQPPHHPGEKIINVPGAILD